MSDIEKKRRSVVLRESATRKGELVRPLRDMRTFTPDSVLGFNSDVVRAVVDGELPVVDSMGLVKPVERGSSAARYYLPGESVKGFNRAYFNLTALPDYMIKRRIEAPIIVH